MDKLKYYVTFKRTQNVTFQVEANNEREAIEQAIFNSNMEELPVDIGDHEDEYLFLVSEAAFNFYNKKNNEI